MSLFKDFSAIRLMILNELALEAFISRLLLVENLLDLRLVHINVGEVHVLPLVCCHLDAF